LTVTEGVAWLPSETKPASADQKAFADGREVWMAHVAGDLLSGWVNLGVGIWGPSLLLR
jgi:hypothetical protein